MELKYLTEDNSIDMARLWRYSFDPAENSFEKLEIEDMRYMIPRTLGCFIEGELKATTANLDYEIYLRGKWLKVAALAGVATAPEYRRKGVITKVMKQLFKDMKEQGQSVSALYPFSMLFYEKCGYKMASETETISFAANELKKRPVEGITVKLVEGPEDNKKAYSKVVEKYNLIFRRNDIMWADQFKHGRGYNYVLYRGEEPVGYAKLNFPRYNEELSTRKNGLIVMDYFWDSPETRQAVFNFLHDHDSQRKYIKMREIDPSTIYLFLKDGGTLERKITPGMMFRVIDVKTALESVTYPIDFSGKCTFAITDDDCPWNNNDFSLEVKNGEGTVKIIENGDLDFKTSIGPFSQLFAGYFAYHKLVDAGEIIRISDSRVPERIFPEMYNLPRNHF